MKDYDNRIRAEDVQLAQEITRNALGRCDTRPTPIPIGSVNKVFRVISAGQLWILRFSEEHGRLAEYQKERWCSNQARARGVPTPEIVLVGEQAGVAYMFQRFIEGVPVTDPGLDQALIWSALGAHLSQIHTIPTQGFGLELRDQRIGLFTESWERHLAYNRLSLGPHDRLRQLDYLTPTESELMTEHFDFLDQQALRFGLCHGDISLRNVIVGSDQMVHLLDWGSAHAHVVPYSDFAHILRWAQPTRAEFEAFLLAYGVSGSAFDQMQPMLVAIALLNATDKLRWALDHNHDSLERYVAGLRWALAIASDKGDWFTIRYTED